MPRIWSILAYVTSVLEIGILLLSSGVVINVIYILLVDGLSSSIPLLVFFSVVPSIVKEEVKSPVVIIDLYITPSHSIIFPSHILMIF